MNYRNVNPHSHIYASYWTGDEAPLNGVQFQSFCNSKMQQNEKGLMPKISPCGGRRTVLRSEGSHSFLPHFQLEGELDFSGREVGEGIMIWTWGRFLLDGMSRKFYFQIFWVENAFSGNLKTINVKFTPAMATYTALKEIWTKLLERNKALKGLWKYERM